MLLELLIGGAVAAGTYLYAKRKKASSGQAGTAAALTGVAGAGAAWAAFAAVAAVWPVLIVGAFAGGYYLHKKRAQKALPPARSS